MENIEDLDEFQIPQEALERMNDPVVIKKYLDEKTPFQEILGFSDETMEKFYTVARRLFEKQEYEKAAEAFMFLTTLNPFAHHYWLGLGMAEQLCGEHHGALMAYGMAMMTDKNDPLPHYHSAACYKLIHDPNNAAISLELALKHSEGRKEFKTLREQAQIQLDRLRS
jgi:type III secretion system low calcium response chaperone LcrH/SycD